MRGSKELMSERSARVAQRLDIMFHDASVRFNMHAWRYGVGLLGSQNIRVTFSEKLRPLR